MRVSRTAKTKVRAAAKGRREAAAPAGVSTHSSTPPAPSAAAPIPAKAKRKTVGPVAGVAPKSRVDRTPRTRASGGVVMNRDERARHAAAVLNPQKRPLRDVPGVIRADDRDDQ